VSAPECSYCVMDSSASDIKFDKFGRCSYCQELEGKLSSSESMWLASEDRAEALRSLASKIKSQGKGKPYDCVIGVSGGVDSSWVLVEAVNLGLRPLAVHMDNGWNSNLAVSNISNLLDELGLDLFSYVIDWEEYKVLMNAFFESDVIDIELLYDNALHEVCYSQAKKYGLKTILSGSNISTEGIRMPPGWAWISKWDGRNIKAIAKNFGAGVRTFPLFTTWRWIIYTYLFGVRWVPFLDYLDYRKEDALETLESQYGYQRYPYKHYESVFTRFYQGYILPKKFNVDKRRVHLSGLIVTGQMTREIALDLLKSDPYVNEFELNRDKDYFLTKMGWDESKLKDYLARAGVPHEKYGSDLVRRFVILAARLLRISAP
jgi:N-acetyl sugar amidotransferase